MREQVHISQFYFCPRLASAVEMCYAVELSKYLYQEGYVLSLDGVQLPEVLKGSRYWDYFRIAVDEGWIVNVVPTIGLEISIEYPVNYTSDLRNVLCVEEPVPLDMDDVNKRKMDAEYNFRTPVRSEVAISKKNEEGWLWEYVGEMQNKNMRTLVSAGADTCWISFVAYVGVQRYLTGAPQQLVICISNEMAITPFIMSGLINLVESPAVSGWCNYYINNSVSNDDVLHLGFSAWYWKGEEQGMLKRWFSVQEKLDKLKELNLQVGDVVGVYKRYVKQQQDNMKRIIGFKVGIIREITDKGIKLCLLNTKKTLCQGDLDYQNFSMATKQLYMFENPYKEINTSIESIDWLDIGVEYAMYNEGTFIIPLDDDDSRTMHVYDAEGKPVEVELSANNLTYWILKDYDVDFNEERFLQRYFPNDIPLRTEMLGGNV